MIEIHSKVHKKVTNQQRKNLQDEKLFKEDIIAAVIVAVSLISNIVAEIPHNSYKPPPIPYQFSYGVSDPYGGTDFSQDENSDGNLVQGTYTVQLPDGRRQIVLSISNI
ncbi:hypothetical protein Avbf_08659 [Armadillidium vulgare]|nr:hypothetical protein Avbf_08659 [Armadillidium vulgare]